MKAVSLRTEGEGGVLRLLARTGYVILLCYHIAWVCIGAVACVQVGPRDIEYVKKYKSKQKELKYAVKKHLYPPAICHDVRQSERPRHLQSYKCIDLHVHGAKEGVITFQIDVLEEKEGVC